MIGNEASKLSFRGVPPRRAVCAH